MLLTTCIVITDAFGRRRELIRRKHLVVKGKKHLSHLERHLDISCACIWRIDHPQAAPHASRLWKNHRQTTSSRRTSSMTCRLTPYTQEIGIK